MSKSNQSLLARFSVLVSVFALLMVVAVAVTKDNGSSSTTGGSTAAAPIPIALSEFKLSPSDISVPKGGSIIVTNDGTVAHNLNVTNTALKTADIAPKGTATLDVSSLAVGTYDIFCAIPGHKDAGMKGTLTITDGTTSGGTASGTDAHAGHDLNSLTPASDINSKVNKALNASAEKSMTQGVTDFLAFAKKYAAGKIKTGNAVLAPKILADGTKQFTLTAAITTWEVSPGNVVNAWTYNGIVPGPWIKVNPNDKIQVVLHNNLPVSTDIHWHGISVPNGQDGLAPITQPFIEPGTTYTYKFTAPNHPELAMYHAHMHGTTAVLNGLFAAIEVGQVPLTNVLGKTIGYTNVPAQINVSQEIPMVLNDAGVIGLSINGKAFPETAPVAMKKGDWIEVHYYNEGLLGHPMHLHRQTQIVIAKDGFPLASPYQMDTLWVAPGERYTVLVHADEVGTWAWHCHILSHAETDAGLTGMVTALVVS